MIMASLNMTNIANVQLAEGAVETIQDHGIWIPDVANLTEVAEILNENFTLLAIHLNSIINMEDEVEKYSECWRPTCVPFLLQRPLSMARDIITHCLPVLTTFFNTLTRRYADASGLNVNDLFSITPRNDSTNGDSIKDPPNGYGVDCGHCHLCEEACIATIWFPPFLWL